VLSPGFLVPEAIAVVTLMLFIRHARLGSAPFIPLDLRRGRGFGTMNLINFLHGCTALGFSRWCGRFPNTTASGSNRRAEALDQ